METSEFKSHGAQYYLLTDQCSYRCDENDHFRYITVCTTEVDKFRENIWIQPVSEQ